MTGKGVEGHREHLADIIVEAIKNAGKDDIVFTGFIGSPIKETRLINGLVLDKEIPPEVEIKKLKDAKIGLLDMELDMRPTEVDTQVRFSNYSDIDDFQKSEDNKLDQYAEDVAKSGVNIIFSTKSIHDKVIHKLSNKGIIAIRRVNKYDMEMLSKTTGAKIVTNVEDLIEENTGIAGKIWQERISDDECKLFIEECPNKGYTIVVCSTSEHLMHETKRAITDGLGDVIACKDNYYVAGGGAIEMEISKELRSYSQTLKGRERLAITSFAEALESIPKTLAKNAGMDPINVLSELSHKHSTGEVYSGLNLFEDKMDNTLDIGIIEPSKIKTLALSSATEVAGQILRIGEIMMAQDGK
ncbi:MAG: TCP-1/cpn60 chaperonin family protein [Thermodesulfobacteriota bacterium]